MAANHSSRIETHAQSSFSNQPLEDPELQQALCMLRHIFQTSLGPKGKLKYLHNDSGGQVTVTSCSGRLLHSMSVRKPALKLVTTAVQEHLRLYSDGGNLTGLVCLLLVDAILTICPQLNRRLIAKIYEILLDWCTDILNRHDSGCHHAVNFSNQQDLLVLTSSVIGSKIGCLLYGLEKEHIVRLLVDVFLKTFTAVADTGISCNLDSVRFLCIEGASPLESIVRGGLFLETPHIPTYRKTELVVKQVTSGKNKGCVSMALFNISLSGDSDDFVDAVYELTCDINLEEAVLLKIDTCVDWLLDQGVGLLACQKVVHPHIKKKIREMGVLCLDRLGIVNTKHLCMISGCQIFSVLEPSLLRTCDLGHLSSIDHSVFNNKSYIHIQGCIPDISGVNTVLLYHWSEEALQEMKYVCQTALHCMKQTSRTSVCLAGGGCWQTWLAHFIHNKALQYAERTSKGIGCTKTQFLQVAGAFVSSLERTALAIITEEEGTAVKDNKYFHLWSAQSGMQPSRQSHCQCGTYTMADSMKFTHLTQDRTKSEAVIFCHGNELSTLKPKLLDSFLPAISALRTGVSIAGMIITIGQFICDDS